MGRKARRSYDIIYNLYIVYNLYKFYKLNVGIYMRGMALDATSVQQNGVAMPKKIDFYEIFFPKCGNNVIACACDLRLWESPYSLWEETTPSILIEVGFFGIGTPFCCTGGPAMRRPANWNPLYRTIPSA